MYAVMKHYLCGCGQIIIFLGEGQADIAEYIRERGIATFCSEDGARVKCPTCGTLIDSPIPELFDIDRHPFGRLLTGLDRE